MARDAEMKRILLGISSIISVILHPLGPLLRWRLAPLRSADRQARGLVLVLPGIEGESLLNHDLALGLAEGGVDCAIEVFDWTTGWFVLAPLHLRSRRLHERAIGRLRARMEAYRREYPGRPIHLVGHSGGGALAFLAVEQLEDSESVDSVILLAAAVARQHSPAQALSHATRGVWNFSSRGDWFFVTLGTLALGSVDGRHSVCVGACGFTGGAGNAGAGTTETNSRLHEVPFRWSMARSFHFGGHFGCVNRLFVAEYVAPLLRSTA